MCSLVYYAVVSVLLFKYLDDPWVNHYIRLGLKGIIMLYFYAIALGFILVSLSMRLRLKVLLEEIYD
jgi:hypothetical protein